MARTRSIFHTRVRAVSLVVAAMALGTAGFAPRPSPWHDDPRLRLGDAIARTSRLHLSREGIVFETPGALGLRDAIVGRAVLFAASERPGGARDVWRAIVRASPRGTLLGMRGPVNLTASPIGDDGPLVADRSRAPHVRVAFATRAFDQVQSVAVLDSRGEAAVTWRQGITHLLGQLSWRGVARWDLRFDDAARDAVPSFDRGALVVHAAPTAWRVDVARAVVTPSGGASFVAQQDPQKPLVHWAVDTVRGISWVGPVPIATLERWAFGVRDRFRQTAFRWFGSRPDDGSSSGAPAAEVDLTPITPAQGRTLAHTAGPQPDRHWPPSPIAAPLAATLGQERGEGVWVDAAPPWLLRHEGAPTAFVRTWLRLDPVRPYARVVLAAIDLRQIELSMQAGIEDPVPLVGPRGDGRIPRDPAVLSRVVGAFNGAFKTEHGEYGMVVDRRVLLPPRPRAATVATLADGRVAMGTWDASSTLPDLVRSLRQNLDPLVADGVENPARRGLWGFVLGGIEHMPTARSGLCIDDRGVAMYVWGEETTARLLGRAMRLAGCTYGMHLDMNPGHAVFQFLRVEDLRARRYEHQSLASGMRVGGERFLYYSPKDFFYLTLRPLTPAPAAEQPWTATPRQPAPAWMPAVVTTRVGPVAVASLALDRVTLRLRAGRQEPLAPSLVSGHDTLDADVPVVGAMELGRAPSAREPRGLSVGGAQLLPFGSVPGRARLIVTNQRTYITSSDDDGSDAIEGTLLIDGARGLSVSDDAPGPRAAVGLTRDRRLLWAESDAGVEALQRALVTAGAESALLLLPSPEAPRAHWGDDVLDAYASTTLFALASEMPAATVRLEALLTARSASQPVATADAGR